LNLKSIGSEQSFVVSVADLHNSETEPRNPCKMEIGRWPSLHGQLAVTRTD